MTSAPRFEDALAHLDAGAVAEAARVLDALAAATPGHATTHVLRAQVAEGLHRWADALAAWRAAAVLLPDAPLVRQGTLRAARVLAVLQPADAGFAPRWGRLDPAPEETPAEVPVAETDVAEPEPAAVVTEPAAEPEVNRDEAPAADVAAPEPETPAATADEPGGSFESTAVPAESETDAPAPAESDTAAPDVPAPEEPPAAPRPFGLPGSSAAAFLDADGPPPPWAPLADTPGADAPAAPARPALPADLDLDRLIDELNTAGRIVPRTDVDRVPAPDLDDDIDDMVSETLARIYAGQGQYAEAARVYEQLAFQQPDRADHFRAEADALRAKGKG